MNPPDELKAAEQAEQLVKDYQRWLNKDWSSYDSLVVKARETETKLKQQQTQYETETTDMQLRRAALKKEL